MKFAKVFQVDDENQVLLTRYYRNGKAYVAWSTIVVTDDGPELFSHEFLSVSESDWNRFFDLQSETNAKDFFRLANGM